MIEVGSGAVNFIDQRLDFQGRVFPSLFGERDTGAFSQELQRIEDTQGFQSA